MDNHKLGDIQVTAKVQVGPVDNNEQSLVLVKPKAMNKIAEVIAVLHRERLLILQNRRAQLTFQEASAFYSDEQNNAWFKEAITNLSSGPLMAMIVSGPNAIQGLVHLVEKIGSDFDNGLYVSPNKTQALRELHFFFPEVIVEPILGQNMTSLYMNQNVHPILTIGLSKVVRERPKDPVMWLSNWLLANNPNKPKKINIDTGVNANATRIPA